MFIPILALLFSSSITFAQEPGSQTQADELCNRGPNEIQKMLQDPKNRIPFENEGGISNGGVCWWHSRLLRSAIYLTRFNPKGRRPTPSEAAEIIRDLIHFRGVVTISGFENFRQFSSAFRKEMQHQLNQWQVRDGFVNQRWVTGLSGKPSLPADKLAAHMDSVYETFQVEGPGLFLMLQVPGIASHAYLVSDMKPTAGGYQILAVDSNQPLQNPVINYRHGMTSLNADGLTFVPYSMFTKDMKKINNAVASYCAE